MPGRLNERAQGWLAFLYRKAMTPDDWSEDGEPHPWWDRYSTPPMTSFPRFDLSESSYALAMMADQTPAWREVYVAILDQLVERYTTFWSAVDWLTQFGHDPQRGEYPEQWKGVLIPEHLWGRYDAPGWTANGIDPWGLQPDPIGADGNLFFRGFFNLLLSIYRYVSGDDKWERPFLVAGVERSRHEWSHPRIAEFLSHQWADRPEGPHCENTKIWPYCLSAAGLGLALYDRVAGQGLHWVFDRWVEHAKRHYMTLSPDGRVETMALYYDPIERHVHAGGAATGLAPAFYVLPQNRALAQTLYESGVEALGWRDPDTTIEFPDPRMPALVHVLARELGDDVVAERLRGVAETAFEPRAFAEAESEFGYWFGLGEEHPRGQLSALAICADIGDPNAWSRVFEAPNLEKFDQPTVSGVDFPRLGVAEAYNDTASGILYVETVAMRSVIGAPTTFRVERLPSSAALEVRCDGQPFERWRVVGEGQIELSLEYGAHRFEILTRPGAMLTAGDEATFGEQPDVSLPQAKRGRRRSPPLSAVRAAGDLLRTGSGICPCCR